MQATLPVRTYNTAWLGLLGLVVAAAIFIGAALVFAAPRGATPAGDIAAQRTIEQSVLNHVADERAGLSAPANVFVDPNADDKVGSRNLIVEDRPLQLDPNAADNPGARARSWNVPQ